jgi:putative transposase
MEAYLHGTSTRKVDDLVKALGADSGIAKSEVSWICAELGRSGGVPGPQPGRAAVSVHVLGRERRPPPGVKAGRRPPASGGQGWPQAARQGLALTPARTPPHCCKPRIRSRSRRGLTVGGCRVHFLRNVLTQVPKGHANRVAAAIRTIFAQPDVATGARTSCPALPRPGGSPRSGDDQSPAWWQT